MKVCILCGKETGTKFDICDDCTDEIMKEVECTAEKDGTDNG